MDNSYGRSTPLFHVHPVTGAPVRCKSNIHQCPASSYENHFETAEAARSFYEEFTRKLNDSTASVEFHFITDEEEDAFTNGDCGILAQAIHKKTGWPLVIAGRDECRDLSEIIWDHMAVRTPDGRLLDAVGITTESQFKEDWGDGTQLLEISSDEWAMVHPWKQQYDSSPVKASNKILKVLAIQGLFSA